MKDSLYVIYKDGKPFRDLGGQIAHLRFPDAYHAMMTYVKMIAHRDYEVETDKNWSELPEIVRLEIIEECSKEFEIVEYGRV